MPQVVLDTTLAELYAFEDVKDGVPATSPAHLNAFPCSDCAMTSQIPKNRKYLYQDSELVKPWTDDELLRLRRILAIKLLNVLSQRYSFVCGKLNVMMLDPEAYGPSSQSLKINASAEYAKAEAERTFSVLASHQRPILHLYAGTAAARLPPGVTRMTVAMPFDGFDHIRHSIDADCHYELLSKGCLAISGLPTPRAEVIPFEAEDDLIAITNKHQDFFPDRLDTLDPAQLEVFQRSVTAAGEKVVERMMTREPPFVVKTQQSSSGGGTYLIRNEGDRIVCIKKMRSRILPLVISSINSSNKHLSPASIIITDFVPAVRSSGVSFFVTQSGRHHILSATQQEFDEDGFWTGGTINYASQQQQRERYDNTVAQTAKFLHAKGYCGPVGIDVLEDEEDRQFIVDLNVRVPGSLPLGLLSGFFYKERGLQHGYIVLGVRLALTREAFFHTFQKELEAGKIVIIAWYEDKSTPENNSITTSWTN